MFDLATLIFPHDDKVIDMLELSPLDFYFTFNIVFLTKHTMYVISLILKRLGVFPGSKEVF